MAPQRLVCIISLTLSLFLVFKSTIPFLSDRYLGFSWASGVVTINNKPYPNGRNQESVSEAIAAYEAVALYGDVMQNIYFGSASREDLVVYDTAVRIRDMGRLLMASEIRSAKTYWHVQAPGTPGVSRIYPGSSTIDILTRISNG